MRLIDADALMNDIDNDIFNTESRKCYEKMRVRKQPTIDAVPVVRCKECIYKAIPKCCPYQINGFKIQHDWYCPMGVKEG